MLKKILERFITLMKNYIPIIIPFEEIVNEILRFYNVFIDFKQTANFQPDQIEENCREKK